jgi:hypothetical protein
VIELQPGDREEVIASGLPPSEAEDLCASRIEALRRAAPPLPMADADPQAKTKTAAAGCGAEATR